MLKKEHWIFSDTSYHHLYTNKVSVLDIVDLDKLSWVFLKVEGIIGLS